MLENLFLDMRIIRHYNDVRKLKKRKSARPVFPFPRRTPLGQLITPECRRGEVFHCGGGDKHSAQTRGTQFYRGWSLQPEENLTNLRCGVASFPAKSSHSSRRLYSPPVGFSLRRGCELIQSKKKLLLSSKMRNLQVLPGSASLPAPS